MTVRSSERILRALQRRARFSPFSAALGHGDPIAVDHPEDLILRGGAAVLIAADGTPTLLAHECVRVISGGRPAARN